MYQMYSSNKHNNSIKTQNATVDIHGSVHLISTAKVDQKG